MIDFFHVTKMFRGERVALSEVTFTANRHEFVFLTGASGAGKSTLLRMIYGDETSTSGHVMVQGEIVGKMNRAALAHLRRQIGVVHQDYRLIPSRTVAENIALPLEITGTRQADIAARVERQLKETGLTHRRHDPPESLSGGEQQRCALARALVAEPKILLADEPTGNLDVDTSLAVFDIIERAHNRGVTVIMATHDDALTRLRPRRILRLNQGRLEPEKPRFHTPWRALA